MKQNNTNMLFKSLALCFLILGNLISDVLCKVPLPTSSITSTIPVTVVEGEVEVPKRNACYAINNHYKVKSTKDFFKDLVSADEKVTDYKFQFNSTGSGKDILTNKIMPVINRVKTTPPLIAEDLFKGFEAIVGKIKTDAKKLKTPVTVNVADFGKFMIELDGPGCALSFNDIVDNLVVYLNCTLDDLKKEVAKVKGNVPIDATLINALNDVKADKNKVLEAIYERVNTAAKKAVVTTMSKLLAIAPTSKPTSLKELFEALNSYGSQTVSKNATTNVEYSIVDAAIADSIPFDIKAADIGNDKIFLSQFIDTKNVLAKDVFVAICEKCTDVNDRLKAILSKLKTDFTKTVEDALSKCVSDKTVSKDKFNEIFTIAFPVAVIDSDIGDRKIKLCWLPDNTDPGQQFNNFSYWLESNNHLQSKYFNDKETAINEFFKVFEDKNKLAGYKKQLEEELKNLKSKTSTPENNSNGPENFTSGMKLITIICIVIGGVFGGLFIIFAGYFGWKFYSKKDKI